MSAAGGRPGVASGNGPTSPTADGTRFRLDIQGLRGIAVLLVVVYHSRLALPGGYVGVDVFFVISGFVIGQMILRELERSGSINLRTFYARRVRRLLPALALVSAATFVLAALTLSPAGPQQLAARAGAATSVFVANFSLYRYGGGYFEPSDEVNPFLHMWSLSVEEQFYLVMPITMLAAWRLGRRRVSGRVAIAVAFATASVASLVVGVLWSFDRGYLPLAERPRFAFYSPFGRVWEFGAGVLLALAASRIQRLRGSVANVLAASGAIAITYAVLFFDQRTTFPGVAVLLPVVGAGLLIAAGTASSWATRPLGWRPLTFVGDVSYGWYLWHWPVMVVAAVLWPAEEALLAVAAGLSLLLAVLSHRWIEDPIRRNGRLVGWRIAALATPLILLPVGMGAALQFGANRTWWVLGPADTAAQALSRSHQDGCIIEDRAEGCYYPVTNGDSEVLLVGDSHADAISDAVRLAARENDASFGVWSPPRCLFLKSSATSDDCRQWQRAARRWILEQAPDVVVIAGYSTAHVTGVNSGQRTDISLQDADGRIASTEAEATELYEVGLEEITRTLGSAGIETIIVSAIPDYDRSPFDSWSLLRPSPRAEAMTVSEARERVGPVALVEAEVATHPGVHLIDPIPHLCDDDCSQRRDGSWVYRDTDHLSLAGASQLQQPISELLDKILSADDAP